MTLALKQTFHSNIIPHTLEHVTCKQLKKHNKEKGV